MDKILVCCFSSVMKSCSAKDLKLIEATELRVRSILNASKIRQDSLPDSVNFNEAVHFHKNCVSSYTSKTHLKRLQSKLKKIVHTQSKNKRYLPGQPPVNLILKSIVSFVEILVS